MNQYTTSSSSTRRQLGRTGIEVSSVGIGTWAMGAEWGTQEDQQSIAALHRALDQGCRLIDTAQVFTGETLRRTVSHVNALQQIAAEVGSSMIEFAVRYCISDPAVSSTIPGARTPEQAEALMRAMQAGPLPESALRRIEELWERDFKHQIRTSIGPGSEG